MASVKLSRYKNLIILYALYIVFWVVLIAILKIVFFPEGSPIALTRFIPINDALIELVIVFVIILPISGVLGIIIGGYVISPIIMVLHKGFYRSKKYYGIQYETDSKRISLLSFGFYPVLMAINLSFMFLTPEVIASILETSVISEFDITLRVPIFTRLLAETILLMVTFGLSTLLFSPIWILKDSGIIFTNKIIVENSHEKLIIKSIGDWFQTILKGYSGIGVIITYFFVITNFITHYIDNLGLPGNLLNIPSLILWLGLPFYLVLSTIPALILHDIIKKHRINYVRKIGVKVGIKDTAIASFKLEKIEKNKST